MFNNFDVDCTGFLDKSKVQEMLATLEKDLENGLLESRTKKERLEISRTIDKMTRSFGGIKEMEEHIKQQMIWAGRPGMWDDWLAFQKAAKEERQKREAEERARREELKQLILYTLYAVCGLAVFVPTLFIILTILK